MHTTKNHIPSLNGLRALCIIMVVGYHLHGHNFLFSNKVLDRIERSIFNGQIGVNIFFVISGFLITMLLIKEKLANREISLKKFYIRRTIRIFPAYYFLIFVYFILNVLGYLSFPKAEWLVDITYTKQFFPNVNDLTTHFWSLSVEELFYLGWPLIFIKGGKHTVKIIGVLIAIIAVLRFINFAFPIPHWSNSIFSVGDALLVGCLFAMRYDKAVAYVNSLKGWFIIYVILLIAFIFSNDVLFYLQASVSLSHDKMAIIAKILSPLCYALFGNVGVFTNIIIGLIIVYSINIKGVWFAVLNLPVIEYIGKLSYGLYLWQQLFTADLKILHQLPLILLLIFIFLAACFSYYVIEKPALKLKKRFETVSRSV